MTNHPNRSKASGFAPSFVIYLPAVKRLWCHHQANSEAIFSSAHNARRVVEGFSRAKGGAPKAPGKALIGAKVMEITSHDTPGAHWHDRWWLIEV